MKFFAVVLLFCSFSVMACEQKFVKEGNVIKLVYTPKGCEYDRWKEQKVIVRACDGKEKYHGKKAKKECKELGND